MDNGVTIVTFEDWLAADFERLNYEWLTAFDLLEPADELYMKSPKDLIVAKGGQVFFAIADGVCVGTCAVIKVSQGVMELAKLAVTAAMQGRGIGRRLTLTALGCARSQGANKVILVSNHKLTSAIRLYESIGFQHAPLPKDTGYASADVYMEYSFDTPPATERESQTLED